MKVEDIRETILDPKKLPLPPKPKVIDIKVFPYVDHSGEDALRVWILLDDTTTRADRAPRNLNAIHLAIADALLAAGIRLFPYTRMATPSDLKEAEIEL
jgi:hypothetical protein